jgi:hypothetical protein
VKKSIERRSKIAKIVLMARKMKRKVLKKHKVQKNKKIMTKIIIKV